jgi:hypothetical protein
VTDSGTASKRALEVHGTVNLESTEVEKRLSAIESSLKSLSSSHVSKFFRWLLDVLKALLPSIVLFFLGLSFKDTVEQSLRQRQLQLDAIKSMQTLSKEFQNSSITLPDARADAAQLAAYGSFAVPLLVNVLEIGNQNTVMGAEDGLRMVARSDPKSVCDGARGIIRNRTGLYHWRTHLSALRLLEDAGCTEALPELEGYQSALKSSAKLTDWVAEPSPEGLEIEKVDQQLGATVTRLKQLPANIPASK